MYYLRLKDSALKWYSKVIVQQMSNVIQNDPSAKYVWMTVNF